MPRLLITAVTFAAGMVAAQVAAAADVPGDKSTRAILQLSPTFASYPFDAAGDKDWYRVNLTKGQDYHIGFSSYYTDGKVTLRDSAGKALAAEFYGRYFNVSNATGISFRAGYTGLHYVAIADVGEEPEEITYPAAYRFLVTKDCADDFITRCQLPQGKATPGVLTTGNDQDFFYAELQGNRTYVATMSWKAAGPYLDAYVRHPTNIALQVEKTYNDNSTVLTFKTGSAGRYFVVVAGTERSESYSLLLKPR